MIRNLEYIRSKDPRLYEALSDLIRQQGNISQQVNGNVTGQPLPPPSIDGLTVTGQNGQFHIQVSHHAQFYRGIQYYAEYADNPGFASPHTVNMGDSREHTQFLGNGTYYWRAYAAYASSPPSAPAYHGGSGSPQPVSGGGSVGGPALLAPQGTGTGTPGQGLAGPGTIPFRSTTGAPPIRGNSPKTPTAGGGTGRATPAGPSTGLPVGGIVAGGGAGGGSISGMQFLTAVQSGLAAIAAGLTNSSQVTVYVSDYDHTLVWTGSAWRFQSGERSGFIEAFLLDPNPTTGWQLCDGSAGITYLKFDGTTGTQTMPALTTSPAFLQYGATASITINAAVAPTLAMASYTPAGTVSQPTFTGNSATPTGTVSQPTFTGNALATHQHEEDIASSTANIVGFGNVFGSGSSRTPTASVIGSIFTTPTNTALTSAVSGGTPSGTVSQPTFTGNSATPTGTVSQPTFSGTPATLTGTISSTAVPSNIVLRPWFRR